MRSHLTRLYRDERGISFVFIGMGFMAFLSATTLAIDVGMFMTARSQAQNAADAGALAGATALALDSFTDRTPGGPAVQSTVTAALANQVIAAAVSVGPSDVSFPLDPNGQPTRVKVNVYRTAARSNPLPTLMGRFFGVSQVDILATATAEASAANMETCVLPFTVPDKWIENSDGAGNPDGPWSPSSAFDIYYSKGSNQNGGAALPNPDVYVPPGETGYTGFDPTADKGTELVLKSNNTNKVSPSIYNPWDLPGSTGASDYSNNISTCNTDKIKLGDMLTPETGNMVGPTKSGVDALIAEDPTAYWDTTNNCVMRPGTTGCVTSSPRIGIVPLYNPIVYAQGQQSGKSQPQLQVTNFFGFFVEGISSGGDVTGRIYPVIGLSDGTSNPTGVFPRVIRLVQ